MPEPRPSVTDDDLKIAARLRTFREQIRWSQAEFAKAVGLTRDQLSSVEYGRTPLRYDVAWRIFEVFKFDPARMAFGATFDGLQAYKYPPSTSVRIPKRALLRDIAAGVKRGDFGKPEEIGPLRVDHDALGGKLHLIWSDLQVAIRQWIIRAPEGKVSELHHLISTTAEQFLEALPPESEANVIARSEALYWAKLRVENVQHFRFAEGDTKQGEIYLTPAEPTLKTLAMPTWAQLKADVRRLMKARGATKASLSRHCNVTRQAVATWLDADSDTEPGAEATLKLLLWAGYLPSNQNAASAETLAAPKTQSKGSSSNETTRPSRKKK